MMSGPPGGSAATSADDSGLTGTTPHARNADTRKPLVVIEARPQTIGARLKELWRYRSFYGLIFKDITMRRARGTLLGFWWLIIRPLIPAAALIFLFSSVRPVTSGDEVPYPVFFLAGYIPWRLFQSALIYLPRTLGWMQGMMRRTYFPRLLVPLAGYGTTFIEFGVLTAALAVIVGVGAWQGEPFPLRLGWQTLWLIPALLAALAFALAIGLVTGIIALFFRDVVFSIRFFAQMMLFLTPVIWPVTFVPEPYRWALYAFNPMAQVVIVSRWALTGQGQFEPAFVLLSAGSIVVALLAGLAFFFRAETQLGDQL